MRQPIVQYKDDDQRDFEKFRQFMLDASITFVSKGAEGIVFKLKNIVYLINQ